MLIVVLCPPARWTRETMGNTPLNGNGEQWRMEEQQQ